MVAAQVLLDDGREAWVKHANVELIDQTKEALAEKTSKRDEDEADGSRVETGTAVWSLRTDASGFLPRTTIPVHTKSLYRERQGGTKIAAGLLRELASRFRSEPIYALQDRGRNLWLLDPAQRLSIGRSTQSDVVIKENAAAVSRQHAFIAGSSEAGSFYLTDTSSSGEHSRSPSHLTLASLVAFAHLRDPGNLQNDADHTFQLGGTSILRVEAHPEEAVRSRRSLSMLDA